MIRNRKERTLCIDFGRDQLSMLEVADGAVVEWGSRPLPEDALENGDPTDPHALGELVRQSLAMVGSQARRARMALPDEATVSRFVTLPRMPRRDLVRAMHYAAERHIPFPIGRACWSWDVVERTRQSFRVYLVAAWRDVVDHYAEIARTAGLEPELLEPRSIAVARALNQADALVVDASSRRLHLTLLVGGQPTLVDEASTGPSPVERREALERLLQRAFRYQSTAANGPARMAPVLLAGELETAEMELTVRGGPVSAVLNGSLPPAPAGFRAGAYLANLGLSMRSAL